MRPSRLKILHPDLDGYIGTVPNWPLSLPEWFKMAKNLALSENRL